METLISNVPSMQHTLGSMTLSFPWGKHPKFPMVKIPVGQYSCSKEMKQNAALTENLVHYSNRSK